MTRTARVGLVIGFLAAAVAATAVIASVSASGDAVASDVCCFANPRFNGVCSVTPGEGESCASILAYLNNPNSSGKAYCGGTDIRGGWKKVECEP
jgi:hypothetical protein